MTNSKTMNRVKDIEPAFTKTVTVIIRSVDIEFGVSFDRSDHVARNPGPDCCRSNHPGNLRRPREAACESTSRDLLPV